VARASATRAWPEVRRRRLSPEEVAEDQRRRVYSALTSIVAAAGYERLTIKQLIGQAGISRRTFYELFEGKAEAFLGAHAGALDRLDHAVGSACSGEDDWPRRVRAGVGAVLEFAADDPTSMRLSAGEPFIAGPHLPHCQETLLVRFGTLLRAGSRYADGEPPEILEAGLIGGVASVVLTRLRGGSAAPAEELAPQLTEILLTPYLGREEAARIAAGDDR